jgi:hypothetical protein
LQHERLDHMYLDNWAERLGVEALWTQLKAAAEPI